MTNIRDAVLPADMPDDLSAHSRLVEYVNGKITRSMSRYRTKLAYTNVVRSDCAWGRE